MVLREEHNVNILISRIRFLSLTFLANRYLINYTVLLIAFSLNFVL